MVPSIISLSQNTGISILQAQNKIRFRSISYLFIALFNIVVSLAMVEKYAGIGCAIGTSLGTILGPIILMNIYYHKVIHLDILGYWKNVLSMLRAWVIPIGIGVLLSKSLPVKSYGTLLLSAIIFVVIFFISAYAIGFNEYERDLVKEVLNKIKVKKVQK
jgi:O-antigen/teichoic acid export membrane protein